MASKYWIKLYHEILNDPKMGSLPDNLWRRAIELFLLAGELDKGGELLDTAGIAWALRVSPSELESNLEQLAAIGILTKEEGQPWIVSNFAKRQAPTPSTERSRESRERNKGKQRIVAGDATKIERSRQRETWMTKLYRNLPSSPGIYKLSSGSGKAYIGASISIQGRVRTHLSEMSTSSSHWMSSDLKEYGENSIQVEVLELVSDEQQLKAREIYWIKRYPSDSLYNTELTGKRHHSWPKSDDQKRATNRYTDTDTDTDKESISPNGDSAPELQADSEKWDKTNKAIIGNKFLELTHLKPPSDEKTRGYWWGGLHELFKMGNKDPTETCRVIAVVVRYMQDENLTISSPKSLHNLARAVVSGQELKPKNGVNNGHGAFGQDKKSGRAGKSTGHDLKREAVFDPYSGETIRPDG